MEQDIEMVREDLKELESIGATIEYIGVPTEGMYKNYYFEIDENYQVTIFDNTRTSEPIVTSALLGIIDGINHNGEQTVTVIGKNNGTIEEVEHSLNVIKYNRDLKLDGITEVKGATLNNKVYEFGSLDDVATASEYAKNTVVLKIEGNLTIEGGVTLTTVKSPNGYGGPKGLIIYCTGELINNGTITMTGRGAKAVGQNIYLLENDNGSFEVVPASGGAGGAGGYSGDSWNPVAGFMRGRGNRSTDRRWWFWWCCSSTVKCVAWSRRHRNIILWRSWWRFRS